jgi:hypothetical protein
MAEGARQGRDLRGWMETFFFCPWWGGVERRWGTELWLSGRHVFFFLCHFTTGVLLVICCSE